MTTQSEEEKQRLKFYGMMRAVGHFQLTHLALKLDLPKLLENHPQTAEELAQRIGCEADRLNRLLRGMTAAGIIQFEAGAYGLTGMGEILLEEGSQTIPGFIKFEAEFFYHPWGYLEQYLKTGTPPFSEFMGKSLFETISEDEDLQVLFNHSMAEKSSEISWSILENYPFPDDGLIIDVGGGYGELLTAILDSRTRAEGIVFDLPALENDAGDYISSRNLKDRCKFVSGSMFDELPKGGDFYILKWILHDWNDESASTILQRCAEAMKRDSRLLIVEYLWEEDGPPPEQILLRDLKMLLINAGKERTLNEYQSLFDSVGLEISSIIQLEDFHSIMEVMPSRV